MRGIGTIMTTMTTTTGDIAKPQGAGQRLGRKAGPLLP
jgi:hypothetical protein